MKGKYIILAVGLVLLFSAGAWRIFFRTSSILESLIISLIIIGVLIAGIIAAYKR